MDGSIRFSPLTCGMLLSLIPLIFPGKCAAQIFVTNSLSHTRISEYALNGSPINVNFFAPTDFGAYAPTVEGSSIFVLQQNHIVQLDQNGTKLDPSLITGLNSPWALANDNGFLYVSENDRIGKYTTAGATVNASLVTNIEPRGIAASVGFLYVTEPFGHAVRKYTDSGATVNASFITGLAYPTGVAVWRNRVFVADVGADTIGEYDAATGAAINASLITGLHEPLDVAVSPDGLNLYVTNSALGTVAQYTTSGSLVNPTLISGLHQTSNIAVIPEPSAALLIGGTFCCSILLARWRRHPEC